MYESESGSDADQYDQNYANDCVDDEFERADVDNLEGLQADSSVETADAGPDECATLLNVENFNTLKIGVPDADHKHLWTLAKQCSSSEDTAQEMVSDLILTGDYPLELKLDDNNDSTDADPDLTAATKYSALREIIPDADPGYLWKTIKENADETEETFGALVLHLQTTGDYPKTHTNELPADMRVQLKRERLIHRAQEVLFNIDAAFIEEKLSAKPEFSYEEQGVGAILIDCMTGEFCPSKAEEYYRRHTADAIHNFNNFDVRKFLQRISNPVQYFNDETKHGGGPKYKADCYKFLRSRTTPSISNDRLRGIMKSYGRLTACYRFLFGDNIAHINAYLLTDECPRFINELTFIRYTGVILAVFHEPTMKHNTGARSLKVDEHVVCELCEETCPFEDILTCTEAHMFCRDCVRGWLNERVGNGYVTVNCPQTCPGTLPDSTISRVLAPADLQKLHQRRQDLDVAAARVTGIENCLWCGYSYVPREEDVDLICLNPDCGERYCKLCKELAHYPKKCEETAAEVVKRTYIEERMTKVAVRQCPQCHVDVEKVDGCDFVTCKCGLGFCYTCGHRSYHYCDKPKVYISVFEEGYRAKIDAERKYPNIKLQHDPTMIH